MEEQILHYFLKAFSFFVIIFFLTFIFIDNLLAKKKLVKNELLTIKKGENIENVLKNNFLNINNFELFVFKNYYRLNLLAKNKIIHFGDFYLDKSISFQD